MHSITMEQKHIRMRLPHQHLECSRQHKKDSINHFITKDEVYHYDPELKQKVKKWCESPVIGQEGSVFEDTKRITFKLAEQ